jgi:hypothetical protein
VRADRSHVRPQYQCARQSPERVLAAIRPREFARDPPSRGIACSTHAFHSIHSPSSVSGFRRPGESAATRDRQGPHADPAMHPTPKALSVFLCRSTTAGQRAPQLSARRSPTLPGQCGYPSLPLGSGLHERRPDHLPCWHSLGEGKHLQDSANEPIVRPVTRFCFARVGCFWHSYAPGDPKALAHPPDIPPLSRPNHIAHPFSSESLALFALRTPHTTLPTWHLAFESALSHSPSGRLCSLSYPHSR